MSEHTPLLQVIPQRHACDCAVACLAMLLGISYEVALLAIGSERTIAEGVVIKDLRTAAKKLGRPLTLKRTIDLENDTGILLVGGPAWPVEHLVILKDGLIVDTDSMIWDADVYLSAKDGTPLRLLAL